MRLLILAFILACAMAQSDRASSIMPKYGTLIGASIDFGAYNNDLSAYEAQLKRSPAAYVIFLAFPFVAEELNRIKPIMAQIGQRKAIAIVTIEPFEGLEAAQSTEALNALAQQVLQWENAGVTVVVRFAHEMNGKSASCLQPRRILQVYCTCLLLQLMSVCCMQQIPSIVMSQRFYSLQLIVIRSYAKLHQLPATIALVCTRFCIVHVLCITLVNTTAHIMLQATGNR